MKPRPKGFLSEKNIDHQSEIFDYIQELHSYLWDLIRIIEPGNSGNLCDILDGIIDRNRLKYDFPRDAITLKIKNIRKRLKKLEETAPQNAEMHLRAIQLDSQIFQLENLLMEF